MQYVAQITQFRSLRTAAGCSFRSSRLGTFHQVKGHNSPPARRISLSFLRRTGHICKEATLANPLQAYSKQQVRRLRSRRSGSLPSQGNRRTGTRSEIGARIAPTGREICAGIYSQGCVRRGGLHPGLFSPPPSGRNCGGWQVQGSKGTSFSNKNFHAIALHPGDGWPQNQPLKGFTCIPRV